VNAEFVDIDGDGDNAVVVDGDTFVHEGAAVGAGDWEATEFVLGKGDGVGGKGDNHLGDEGEVVVEFPVAEPADIVCGPVDAFSRGLVGAGADERVEADLAAGIPFTEDTDGVGALLAEGEVGIRIGGDGEADGCRGGGQGRAVDAVAELLAERLGDEGEGGEGRGERWTRWPNFLRSVWATTGREVVPPTR